MRFQRNISLLLGRMEASRSVEFIGVEHAGGAEITALVEKAMTGPLEKAATGLHIARPAVTVERCKLCAGRAPLRWFF
jgi:hypothetical protein